MKESTYKNYDDLPLFLNAAMVAQVLGVAPSSAYELMHEEVEGVERGDDARKGLPYAARRQPHGGAEREIHRMGRAAHEGRW